MWHPYSFRYAEGHTVKLHTTADFSMSTGPKELASQARCVRSTLTDWIALQCTALWGNHCCYLLPNGLGWRSGAGFNGFKGWSWWAAVTWRQILIMEAYFRISVEYREFGNVYLIHSESEFREVLNLDFSDFGVGYSARRVFCCSNTEIVGSNPTRGMGACLSFSFLCLSCPV
jgi:hypothetical protein